MTIETDEVKFKRTISLSSRDLILEMYRENKPAPMHAYAAEIHHRQTLAIDRFNEQSSRQTRTLIVLTWWIVVLTVILSVIAGAQLWVAFRC